jgi:hypothetical protein
MNEISKNRMAEIIEGYGEIKKTDMSAYIDQLDHIEEIVPDNTQPLYQKVADQKVAVQKEEDPSTKTLKEKLGIK